MESVGVGMLGLGTVGTAVARRLIGEWELLGERAGATPVLRSVAVRDVARTRDVDLKNVRLVADPHAVVADPGVAIVVEVIGGTDPATAVIESSLRAGKSVVTANKAVIAASGPRLTALAAEHGAHLYFEASVGAGLPIVALLRGSLLGDRISALDCVINGTTNVILTRMRTAGVSFESALADARRRGFAEADPSLDVDGWDAAHKLVILAWLAFGAYVAPDAIDRVGIRDVAEDDVCACSPSSGTGCACSRTPNVQPAAPSICGCGRQRSATASCSAMSMMLTMLSSSRATSRRRSCSGAWAPAAPRPRARW